MHGLTGGSWKRISELAMVAEKNDPGEIPGSPEGFATYRPARATAPAPDPPT